MREGDFLTYREALCVLPSVLAWFLPREKAKQLWKISCWAVGLCQMRKESLTLFWDPPYGCPQHKTMYREHVGKQDPSMARDHLKGLDNLMCLVHSYVTL